MLNRTICTIVVFVFCAVGTAAQSTTITYQGNLQNGGSNANGTYDFQFALFDAASGGTQLGSTLTVSSVTVTNGTFKVDLDFGSQFPGANRFLQISVRQTGGAGYTLLSPRQTVSSVPYSITSLRSADSDRLGGIEANQFLTITSGASVFIQNGSTPQAGGFNLNGTGTANIVNATTQFSLGGSRILSAGGADNIFAGFQAGQANSSGGNNSFFGVLAGGANTTGNFNSFFGRSAGGANSGGGANSFFGAGAGGSSTGDRNTFFGFNAGLTNSTGSFNTVLGSEANVGLPNLTNATAVGYRALVNQSNSLVLGSINGVNGASADTNVGIGTMSPTQRLQVVGNGVFSGNLGIGTTSPSQKLHIFDNGANIVLGGLGCGTGFVGINFFGNAQSNNCINYSMLGEGASTYINRPAGGLILFRMANNDQMVLSASGNLGIGTNSPAARLNVSGGGFGANLLVTDNNTTATTFDLGNTSTGARTWRFQSMGSGNGIRTGNLELWNVGGNFALGVAPNGNVGFGTGQPESRVHVAGGLTVNGALNYFATSGNANFFMKSAGAANGINFGVVGSAGLDSTLYIAQFDGTTYKDKFIIDGNGNITMPTGTVNIGQVSAQTRVNVYGSIYQRAEGGGEFPACLGALQPEVTRPLAACSSSIRYKSNIQNYTPGLDLIRRLRPVSFTWKASNNADFGLVAEETAEIEPLLVTRNDKGEVEGVKYDRVGVVLVNAVGEQQTQLEAQQKQLDEQAAVIRRQQEKLERQQSQIEALKALVCANNRTAEICQEKK